MALTVANVSPQSEDIWGRHRIRTVEVTFDASYPAGGESFTPADVGLAEFAIVIAVADDAGYVVNYDHASETLRVFGVEQDADAAVTDPLDEENDTADLSSLVVRVLCVGY